MEPQAWELWLWVTVDQWVLRARRWARGLRRLERRWFPQGVREPDLWMWVVLPALAFALGVWWGLGMR